MLIKIKKADVLQSIGFALTSAEEEHTRIGNSVSTALRGMIEDGQVVSTETQAQMSRALTTAREHVDSIKLLRRMAEFEVSDEVLLDAESFALIEPNLPAR